MGTFLGTGVCQVRRSWHNNERVQWTCIRLSQRTLTDYEHSRSEQDTFNTYMYIDVDLEDNWNAESDHSWKVLLVLIDCFRVR